MKQMEQITNYLINNDYKKSDKFNLMLMDIINNADVGILFDTIYLIDIL